MESAKVCTSAVCRELLFSMLLMYGLVVFITWGPSVKCSVSVFRFHSFLKSNLISIKAACTIDKPLFGNLSGGKYLGLYVIHAFIFNRICGCAEVIEKHSMIPLFFNVLVTDQ